MGWSTTDLVWKHFKAAAAEIQGYEIRRGKRAALECARMYAFKATAQTHTEIFNQHKTIKEDKVPRLGDSLAWKAAGKQGSYSR